MARTVLPIAGAIIGAFYGNPYAGYAIGAAIAGVVDPINTKGPRIGETGAQTSQEGAPRAIVYGTCQVTGNVIASGPLIKRDVKESQGKGGGSVSTEHAYRTFAVRICEGPVAGFLRVWQDDKLVYDVRPTTTMQAESQKWAANKVFYLGDDSQLPDTSLQMIFGVDETPAHRGSAYMVAIEDDLTDRRGSIPQYRFEVAGVSETIDLEHVFSTGGFTNSDEGGAITKALISVDRNFAAGEVQPLSLVTMTGGPLTGSPLPMAPLRWQIIVNGGVRYDTGWFGNPTDQSSLDNVLAYNGRADLIGPIGTQTSYTEELHFSPTEVAANGPGLTRLWYAGDFTLPIVAFEASLASIHPFPPVAGDYVFHPEYDGVGVRTDESFFSASWGPDSIVIVGSGVTVPLSGIVEDIHARCNFPADKADTSELTDLVSGLVLAGEYTGADAINTLRSLYLFDAADQDRQIVYPKRGKPVVATITEDDIVEAEESSKREQAIEYPKKLHLSYQNAVGGYAVAKATSARSSPDVRVVGEVSTSVPVVLSPDQAAQTAAKMHKIAWAEAEGETKLSVPLSWIKYIASDCFGVAMRGRVTRERLDELNYADGTVEYTLRRDRQSAYTSTVTGIPIPEPTPPPSTIVGQTVLAVLDISPRTENEDDLNLLYAVSGGLPAWNGATVQRSLDAGANFSSVVNINRGPVLGTLVNDLSDASEFYTDTTNVLRVQLYRDTQTIESITDVQFLSEGGAFAVQRPDGSWEVMQYRDADEVSAGVFDLSYMHRGQLNSGTSAHLAGALFVMLADAVHAPAQSAWIGADLTHRAVSYGESPEAADEQTQTYVGRSQIEWPVAYLTLARDGSDNVSATWTPRHRLGTEDAPVESVNFRGYRVTLDDGVLPAVTFDTTAASFTYDASALGTPLTVTVSAINRITGAGPFTSESI